MEKIIILGIQKDKNGISHFVRCEDGGLYEELVDFVLDETIVGYNPDGGLYRVICSLKDGYTGCCIGPYRCIIDENGGVLTTQKPGLSVHGGYQIIKKVDLIEKKKLFDTLVDKLNDL